MSQALGWVLGFTPRGPKLISTIWKMSYLLRTSLRLSSHSKTEPIHPRSASIQWARHLASEPPHEKKTAQVIKKTTPVSKIPEGSPIKGLAYIKGESDPIAKADDQYPSWLWTLSEPNMGAGHTDTPLRAIRRELNRENRSNIRKSNFLKAKK